MECLSGVCGYTLSSRNHTKNLKPLQITRNCVYIIALNRTRSRVGYKITVNILRLRFRRREACAAAAAGSVFVPYDDICRGARTKQCTFDEKIKKKLRNGKQ